MIFTIDTNMIFNACLTRIIFCCNKVLCNDNSTKTKEDTKDKIIRCGLFSMMHCYGMFLSVILRGTSERNFYRGYERDDGEFMATSVISMIPLAIIIYKPRYIFPVLLGIISENICNSKTARNSLYVLY